jgi:hypothetical protein
MGDVDVMLESLALSGKFVLYSIHTLTYSVLDSVHLSRSRDRCHRSATFLLSSQLKKILWLWFGTKANGISVA